MSLLLPEGVDHLLDLPHQMFNWVRSTMVFLSWDELPKDERPPRKIWLKDKELSAHFKAVERRREERVKNPGQEIEGDVSQNQTEELLGMKR